ncbi:MAG: EamA family transporter, partial [Anaerolineae bacterium]|nr:EamA family transporter [Anaerolineae bacterium]
MQRWQADAALVLITAIWGSTFVIVKHTLDTTGPLVLIATRFWVAGLALLIMLLVQRDRANTTKSSTLPALRSGAITGGFLTLGFITQTIG